MCDKFMPRPQTRWAHGIVYHTLTMGVPIFSEPLMLPNHDTRCTRAVILIALLLTLIKFMVKIIVNL